MRLESVDVIHHDGRHNAFTDIVRWKERYWVSFRTGTQHRAPDGRICVISSPDLQRWDDPVVVIHSADDDRDPKLFVFDDRLFATSLTVRRTFEHPDTYSGKMAIHDFYSLVTYTDDGVHWSEPFRTWEPFHAIWWVEPSAQGLFAAGYFSRTDAEGNRTKRSYLIVSNDGLHWHTHGRISAERGPSEAGLAFLSDGRGVILQRHDADAIMEILVADPPYTNWQHLSDFGFPANGPALACINDQVIGSCRVFLTDQGEKVAAPESTKRGVLVFSVDMASGTIREEALVASAYDQDTSYAGFLALDDQQFVMTYYDGHWRGATDIRLARFRW